MGSNYISKNLDHLGLVSGMIDELNLVSLLNGYLNTDGIKRDVSLGLMIKALVLNGLGFSQRTLYMVSHFFSDKPVEHLLGSGVSSSQLNDTSLGRCLDAIYDYGCTELYSNLSVSICKTLGLSPKVVHMDSTDFHLEGVYNSLSEDVSEKEIHLCRGYSRDHRPDCNQVVLNLIVENQAGIVLHMEGLDGNKSDKTTFKETIKNYIGNLQSVHDIEYVVMDSAGYTEETLKHCGDTVKWISRVPETLKESKAVVNAQYAATEWQTLSEGYEYIALESSYGEIDQRWLLVFSKEAYQREILTLTKNYAKNSQEELQQFLKLCRQAFDCQNDAQKAFDLFQKKCKYLHFQNISLKQVACFAKKGKPKKGQNPDKYLFYIQATPYSKIADFQQKAQTKGRFIIASNEQNKLKLTDKQLFINYKGQAKVERGFRFLKDPQFMASSFFVKKPKRVEALLFIMTLCLTVYAAIEFRIRQQLAKQNCYVLNQIGKNIQKPTARWIFATFSGIHLLTINGANSVLNLSQQNRTILYLMGKEYGKYYLLE